MSKQKDLGRALENRVAQRAREKGLEAKRQPGSGLFREAPHDDVIDTLLVECKVRSYSTNAKGEDTIAFPIKALRKVQASALVNDFEQGILVVNPKGSQSPFVFMDLDWFLNLLAEHRRYRKALETIRSEFGGVCDNYELCTDKACADSYAAWATADLALALDKMDNSL